MNQKPEAIAHPGAKRLFDILFSATVLLFASPLILLLAILVRRYLGSPVFFTQDRPGIGGKIFKLIKFRTMTNARDAAGQLLPDAERLTPLGHFLRRTSLDEFPEFWNVLRGDMSIVGPRPLLPHYLPLYTPEQARRQEVRPGLTGWTAVNGRNSLTWEEKFRHDTWYVEHQSFLLDLRIILLTALKVLRREGISASGEATMPEFTGSPATTRTPQDAAAAAPSAPP
ncbi:MAG: sugar transferase [Puniceicoccales bacterium]|jgi:lipopolysaccharide/colanic/teichoic acid biosynthesis glycosyltransferase|nr:sugar transferase [Puniceicoccales bacterium]